MSVSEGMSTRTEFFTAKDRVELFQQTWQPEGTPRAVVVLLHGLIEHSGQHAATVKELVRRGYRVYAMDLRGHGRSDGPRCDVQSFQQYLSDLDVFYNRVRRETDGLPIFLLGNSMGGLITILWSILRQPPLAGLILSGPLLALADGLYPMLRHLAAISAALVPTLRLPSIPFDWLARQRQVVDRFRDDPLVFHGRFTVRMAAEILRAMKAVSQQAGMLKTPLLILHGSQDRICSPDGSRDLYQGAGSADKMLHLYEGFSHEVFDEPGREQVLTDLAEWLDEHLCGTRPTPCRSVAAS
jgi:acylglycerol lipase